MTVNKGLLSLVENTPNFSNQALENAVNTLKIGWVIKSFQLDTAISDNNVLSLSQKNDLKDLINNIAHINLGRVLGDLVRHSATILDGSVIPLDDIENPVASTFLEILQNVQTIQTLVPELYGVPASDKARAVNDHLGTLNNIFITTEDSTAPVFTTLRESIQFITDASLGTETVLETAYDNLKNFINGVTDDSTDFQQTLNTFGTFVASAHTSFNNALANEPYLTHRTRLTNMRESINVQVSLEISNLVNIEAYITALSENVSYTSLAEDVTLRELMTNVSQDLNWQTYFREYETNQNNLNPIYTGTDKDTIINQVLADSGLPDVLDHTNFDAVAAKAKSNSRIDTTGFDRLTSELVITKSCQQLNISVTNRSISNQSKSLLDNLNRHDRDQISLALDLNESSDTLS
tara:strand:- start:278 stop:1501 length:1224 start_codon:yes stop_codon:yes gene_type:complete